MDTEDVQPAPNIDHLLSNIGRTGLLGEASGEHLLSALGQSLLAESESADQYSSKKYNAAFRLKPGVGNSPLACHSTICVPA